jgi:hypothetical protein
MLTDPAISLVMTQLSRIARAPLTGTERELRATSLLGPDVTLEDITGAVVRGDLEWSQQQAIDHGIDVEAWIEAVHVADVPRSESLVALVDRLHRAEAVAEILKAGYTPTRSRAGRLVWSVR